VFVGQQRVGAVSVGLSTAPLRSQLTAVHLESLAVALAAVALGALLALLTSRSISKPLHELMRATKRVAEGHLTQAIAVRGGGEVAALGRHFNEMMVRLAQTYAELRQALVEKERKSNALQRALDQVRRGQEEQEHLLQAIREMSTPVIPVRREVLVMPLVGVIDEARAQNIIVTLLAAIEERRARVVILDITGVPLVDTAVAQGLVRAAQAARLLGAEPVLVGTSPQVAETLIALGADLSDLVARADLQSGLEYAIRRSDSGQH
jgi:rsbT co-antagonist protein RsbR